VARAGPPPCADLPVNTVAVAECGGQAGKRDGCGHTMVRAIPSQPALRRRARVEARTAQLTLATDSSFGPAGGAVTALTYRAAGPAATGRARRPATAEAPT